jgi:16S rRNA (uracil1498-N3)-methyltransferase
MFSVFVVPKISSTDFVVVEGDEAHHAIKVMRLEIGEEIVVTDGAGNWAQGLVSTIDKKSFTVTVSRLGLEELRQPELIVIQALTKSDRMRETIELLTVAGVDRIIPWKADRSIAQEKENSVEKWNAVAVAASKQSRRLRFPVIESAITTPQVVERFAGKLIVLHESAAHKFSDLKFIDSDPVVIVVGPEGGISETELAKLCGLSGTPVRLGQEVFRSAHAGFAALSAIQVLIKRW